MLSKVIGIISFLPNDTTIKEHRINKLLQLIDSCNSLFNLPILIIAQNYKKADVAKVEPKANVKLSLHKKLGITGARKQLREEFITSEYDYLIMLDDDCVITGNAKGVDNYFNDIENHPNGYGLFQASLLKLFAISKTLYKEVEFPDVSPENGDGFEDRVFVHGLLEKSYPELKYEFKDHTNLNQSSINTNDQDST